MASTPDYSRLLRLALGGNAAFSTLSAVIFLAASQPIATFLGFLPGKQVFVLGIQLGVFAAWLAWLSTRPAIPRWQVWLIIALDALWVAGSFQLLLAPPAELTVGGRWAIALVADVVGLLAIFQFVGLRQLARSMHAPVEPKAARP